MYLADVVPRDLVLVRIRLPPKCSAEEPALTALPAGWDAVPIAHASMQFGTWWVQEGRSLVLYVPSALVREESNAVLNPNHPEFRDVRMEVDRDFD